MFRAPFAADGTSIRVRISDDIVLLLRSLLDQLRELLLVDSGEELRRLYPTAYPDHGELEAGYREMVHDQLLMSRLDGIDTMEASLGKDELSIEEADVWMGTINQIRLVLGTKLDVTEDERDPIDPDDPDATSQLIYHLLSQLLESLTSARSQLL